MAHGTTDEGHVVALMPGTCVGEVDGLTEVSPGAQGLGHDAHNTIDEGNVVASSYGIFVGKVDEPTEVSPGTQMIIVILQLTHMTQQTEPM